MEATDNHISRYQTRYGLSIWYNPMVARSLFEGC